jgi:RNA polymerase sigma-70 factor (ECF subfamily)
VTNDTSLGGDAVAFPSTRWTAILSAKDCREPAYRDNLNYLIKLYWKPVYRFIRVGWSKSNEDAKDTTQDFFASLIARDSLKDVSPEKGRFRSFLKAALKNFLMQQKRDAGRQKRGGGAQIMALDWNEVDVGDPGGQTPEEAFDREWANSVLETSMARLKDALAKDGKSVYFELFQKFYFGAGEQLSYDQMAAEHKISKFDVGNYLKAARAKFREVALALIAEYVSGDEEGEREFQDLFGGGL